MNSAGDVFSGLPIPDYARRVPHSVNNAAEGRHSTNTTRIRTLASTLARRPPTNSGDFRASYLASGFGVTRLLATLYSLLSPLSSYSQRESRDFAQRLAPFISDLPESVNENLCNQVKDSARHTLRFYVEIIVNMRVDS